MQCAEPGKGRAQSKVPKLPQSLGFGEALVLAEDLVLVKAALYYLSLSFPFDPKATKTRFPVSDILSLVRILPR